MRSWLACLALAQALAAPAGASSIHTGRAAAELHSQLSFECSASSQNSWVCAVPRLFGLSAVCGAVVDRVLGRASGLAPWHAAANASVYGQHAVLRFAAQTPDEVAALSAAARRLYIDIWSYGATGTTVDVLVDAETRPALLALLPPMLRDAHETLVADVAGSIQQTYPASQKLPSREALAQDLAQDLAQGLSGGTDNIFFRDYQPYPVIEQWMKLLDAMFPFVSMVTVGTTPEGREILGMRLSAPGAAEAEADEPAARKTILVTGGLHAREWISSSSVSYVAWALIRGYGSERMITKLVDHFDLVFVPVVNPDGYQYTWDTDRLWRKTRQETGFRFCRGFDLDHAFGYQWDSAARDEPCSESYGGEAAFQAAEARALADWARAEVAERGVEFVGFLDLHAYSQQILFPFSYTCAADPPNLENLEELAAGLAKAIRLTSGEAYSVSSACEGILAQTAESMGGSAIDWFFHEMHAKYSYQIKLRDTGSYGFLLPASEIVPTGDELFSAVKYFGDFLLGNNGIEKAVPSLVEEADTETETDAEARLFVSSDQRQSTLYRRRAKR